MSVSPTGKQLVHKSNLIILNIIVRFPVSRSTLHHADCVHWLENAFNTNRCRSSRTAPAQWIYSCHADNSMILAPNRMLSSEMFAMSPTAMLFLRCNTKTIRNNKRKREEKKRQKRNMNYLVYPIHFFVCLTNVFPFISYWSIDFACLPL